MRSFDDIPPRYENKYLITAAQADAVRSIISSFAVRDEFSERSPSKKYLITSLYLDTPHLGCWQAWRMAADRRFKLRIRRYGKKLGESPVFLEMKQRVLDVTIKPRVIVPHGEWRVRACERGSTSGPEADFRARVNRWRCEPKLLVRYEREAWAGTIETYARITFDSHVQFARCEDWTLDTDDNKWTAGDGPVDMDEPDPRVLLEVKFERAVPRWMVHVLRSLSLIQRGFSKYGVGVRRSYTPGELDDVMRRESAIAVD